MRIVTYNTQGSMGMEGVRSTKRIAEVMRSLSADVVCFQEIHQRLPWSGREDQPAVLSSLLGRNFIFQKNFHVGFGGYGVGMAVRGRADRVQNHLLPSGKEQRGALEVALKNVGGLRAVTVFCTHWGLQEEERLNQAKALADLVNGAGRPVIVCGDLNETASGSAVHALLSATSLRDADAAADRASFPSDNPDVRIDYVLHTSEIQPVNVEVIRSLASDHLPLVVDFEPAP